MTPWEIHARILKSKRVAVTATGLIKLSPKDIWDLITLPDGAGVFRVEGRMHGADDHCGRWDEQVVFNAAVRVLFWKTLARTRVHQNVDASDPECIKVDFRLLQSDLMSHLEGRWQLQQLAAAAPHSAAVTQVTYSFEMWPKGVPTSLRFMPGLVGAVKEAVKREAAQLMDKVLYVSCKVRPGVTTVQQALQEVTAEVIAAGGSFKLLQQAQQQQHRQQCDTVACTSSSSDAVAAPCHALPDDLRYETDCQDSEQSEAGDCTMAECSSECYSESDNPCSSRAISEDLSSAAAGSIIMECDNFTLSDSSSSDNNNSSCGAADGECVIVDAANDALANKQQCMLACSTAQHVAA